MNARISSVLLGSTLVAVIAGCSASASDASSSDSAVTAARPKVAAVGAYHRATTPDTREGDLMISAATDTTLTFEVTGRVTIKPDEDPHLAGTHEGGTSGTATRAGAEFVFRQDSCVLHFTLTTAQRISVRQDEDTICEPNPLVSLDGDYDLAPGGAPGGAITLANWQHHPTIVAVRKEVESIDASNLKIEKKQFCQNEGVGEFERDKGTDGAGKIRQLRLQAGSDDGAAVTTYYYDASGKLRFVFETENDVHGNSSEDRVYFDADGKRVWEVYRNASDPEHNNPDVTKAPFEAAPAPLDIGPELSDPSSVFGGPPKCG